MFVEIKTECSSIKLPSIADKISITLPQGMPVDIRYTDHATFVSVTLSKTSVEPLNIVQQSTENLGSSMETSMQNSTSETQQPQTTTATCSIETSQIN